MLRAILQGFLVFILHGSTAWGLPDECKRSLPRVIGGPHTVDREPVRDQRERHYTVTDAAWPSDGGQEFHFEARLVMRSGNLTFSVRAVSESGKERASWSAAGEFDAMMTYFEPSHVKRIKATWNENTNLEEFRAGIARGLTPEKAARETWTGRQAARYGFTHVVPVIVKETEGVITSVEMNFERPPN